MGEWLKNNDKVKIELLEDICYYTKRELEKVEYEWIAHMDPSTSLNTLEIEIAIEKYNPAQLTIHSDRYAIVHDAKNKRYRIQWRDNKIKMDKQFSYKMEKPEEALLKAEEFRANLLKENFFNIE